MERINVCGLRVFFLASLILAANACCAQSPWSVTERGPDYKVLQKTTVDNGTNHIHRITILATGLNYTNSSGQLVESSEQITLQPDGTAVANQGRHQVKFPADLYNGVLQVTTPDCRNLFSRPLCVCYDDGSNTVVIATLTNSIGCLTASNQVTYPNCFSGIKADIVATYRRGGFECDLVFREQPPTPDAFGLDASFSTLELVTEFFNTQDPQQVPAASDDWFGLQDNTLKFGKLSMTHGKAFAFKPANSSAAPKPGEGGSTPVYKSWTRTDDGRKFLVEQVPLAYIADGLASLPLTAMGGTDRSPLPAGIPPTETAKTLALQKPGTKPDILSEPRVVLCQAEVRPRSASPSQIVWKLLSASAQPRSAGWENPQSGSPGIPHAASLLTSKHYASPITDRHSRFNVSLAAPKPSVGRRFNCVGAVNQAAFNANVGLPVDISPQNFGIALIQLYPAPGQVIGPFIDTTNAFYSTSPY